MLVLSRKTGQIIRIGQRIVIQVLSADRDRVRFGIEAPDEMTVFRDEVAKRLDPPGTGPREEPERAER